MADSNKCINCGKELDSCSACYVQLQGVFVPEHTCPNAHTECPQEIETCNCQTQGIECDMHPTKCGKGCSKCLFENGSGVTCIKSACDCHTPKQDTQESEIKKREKNTKYIEENFGDVMRDKRMDDDYQEDSPNMTYEHLKDVDQSEWFEDTQETWEDLGECEDGCCYKVEKEFLKAFIKKEREEIMAAKPKGVTAWREEGKKLGYWEYFEEIAKNEAYEKAMGEERERCAEIVESLPVPHCDCEKTTLGMCVICVHKKIIQCSKDKILKQIKLTK